MYIRILSYLNTCVIVDTTVIVQNATTITAANGQELPAIDVFAMTLQFLKDTALQWCKSYDNVKWIVTVPAIWSDAAKEMMRKASEKVCMNVNFITTYI